jgi:hypothetical protein
MERTDLGFTRDQHQICANRVNSTCDGARRFARPPLGKPCDRPARNACEAFRPRAKGAAPPGAPLEPTGAYDACRPRAVRPTDARECGRPSEQAGPAYIPMGILSRTIDAHPHSWGGQKARRGPLPTSDGADGVMMPRRRWWATLRFCPPYDDVSYAFASFSNSPMIASPISRVVTSLQPSDLMSAVRRPLSSVAMMALSIRSASLPMSKE